MLQPSKRKIIIYMLVLALSSVTMYGCNGNNASGDAATDAAADNAPESDAQAAEREALEKAVSEALNPQTGESAPADNAAADDTAEPSSDDQPAKSAIAERSPVEITRIEVPEQIATGAGEVADESAKDPHEHEKTPNLFEIDDCQVEVNGIYQVKLAKDLLKAINSRRKDYGIGSLSQNTSLLACADSRCKEQTYFIGHFRPNGAPFNSVAYDYVQGECIAIDYRTVNDIMEAWFSVNDSRKQLMNPDYTQCGISIYDIDGIYYIAAVFGY